MPYGDFGDDVPGPLLESGRPYALALVVILLLGLVGAAVALERGHRHRLTETFAPVTVPVQ
jgi:hypothetical protein